MRQILCCKIKGEGREFAGGDKPTHKHKQTTSGYVPLKWKTGEIRCSNICFNAFMEKATNKCKGNQFDFTRHCLSFNMWVYNCIYVYVYLYVYLYVVRHSTTCTLNTCKQTLFDSASRIQLCPHPSIGLTMKWQINTRMNYVFINM